MRTIERTSRFKRDYRREARGRHRAVLDERLTVAVWALASDAVLAPRYHDHALSGPLAGSRDCHVRPDLVLVYELHDSRSPRYTTKKWIENIPSAKPLAPRDRQGMVVHASAPRTR